MWLHYIYIYILQTFSIASGFCVVQLWLTGMAVSLLTDCKWGVWSRPSHEGSPLTAQWHVYIPGQGMPEDVGRLTPHVTSLPLVLSPTASTTCPSLEAPAHGTKFGSKYLVGHEVHFTCSQGYHLVGSATRACRDNGTWTGISAICKGEFIICWATYRNPRPIQILISSAHI